MNLEACTLSLKNSVKDALIKLNENPDTLTVFILNESKKLVGTLTDGDVRRGLIQGLSMTDSLEQFMFTSFSYLSDTENNFKKLKELRIRRLKAVPLLNAQKEIIKIFDFSYMKSLLPVDAVIMAGGEGQRLRPLTLETPKPLLKIGGKEIIAYNLERLHKFGIQNQHISLNYKGEQIETFCKQNFQDINFNFVYEPQFLGTAGALGLIKQFHNDTVLLMNSDLLTDLDYEDFYRAFMETNADIMVASVPYTVKLPYAIFDINDRTIKGLKEKPAYTYYANAGIYLIKKELSGLVPNQGVFNATDLLEKALEQKQQVLHYPIRSYWLDIGNHDDFERAQKDVAHIDFN